MYESITITGLIVIGVITLGATTLLMLNEPIANLIDAIAEWIRSKL